MVIKAEVLEVIDAFNQSNHGIRAKLFDSGIDYAKILFFGIFCHKTGDCHTFPAFRELLEAKLNRAVSIKESVRIRPDQHRIAYIIGEEKPADKILKVLHQYEEGTPRRGKEFED
ncbi:MAG: hypothetical protein HY514_00045 [Candidatus Aenigmarchaeota archaeon]|nr:hypothetical protein [Candidatus Aenigmarchaeota archaeon]